MNSEAPALTAPEPAGDADALAQLCSQADGDAEPFDEHRFVDELRALAQRLGERGGRWDGATVRKVWERRARYAGCAQVVVM